MLIISRTTNKQLRIDENITITVLSVDEAQVRLKICAPMEVRVLRCEHYDWNKSHNGATSKVFNQS
ncbi:carbon storage regulator [Pseudomonas sp. TH31]|uniref:carbon storage regulator n=1 Tax=Pseudomonas sp. TH31 TaxID=2796396 RepID=UPI00191174E8|nr:carbon storage regulator [Pseudomonas sp. TH31]